MMKLCSLMLALLLMLVSVCPVSAQETDPILHGIALCEAGEHAASLEFFTALADAGSVPAMVNIGWCYANGHHSADGLPQYDLATEWYRRALDKGSCAAATHLLYEYDLAHIPAEALDFAVIRDLLLAAGDEADSVDLYWTAYGYDHGLFNEFGIPDYLGGYPYYLRSVELGLPEAMHDLAGNYLSGRYSQGVPDAENALLWYTRASQAGLDCAQSHIFNMYRDGVTSHDGAILLEKDMSRACAILEQAYADGTTNTYLLSTLGYYLAGNEDVLVPDHARAFTVYQRGAELGDGYCYAQMAAMYRNGDLGEADLVRALEYAQKAVECGYADAQPLLDQLTAE